MPAGDEESPGPCREGRAPEPQAQTQRGDPGRQEAAAGLNQDGRSPVQAQGGPQERNLSQARAAGTEYVEGSPGT